MTASFFEPALQFAQRLAAVTDFVLHRLAQFGERLVESLRNEERIVAKTVAATSDLIDPSLTSPFENLCPQFRLIRVANWRCRLRHRRWNRCQGDHATEPGRALGLRNAAEQPQQFRVVRLIGGVFSSAALQGGEPGRMD